MDRITQRRPSGFYELKPGKEVYGWENGIRLVQLVGYYEDCEETRELIRTKKVWPDLVLKVRMVKQYNNYRCMLSGTSEYSSIQLTKEEFKRIKTYLNDMRYLTHE